jgi:DNA-binding MarR family transcriptional regulator
VEAEVRREDVTLEACRAAARLSRQVERALSTVELSLAQYRLLALLAGSDEMASALAGLLAVRPASVTAVVDGLVQRGLVERRPGEQDRRCVAQVLTRAGRSALSAGDEAVGRRLSALAGHLDDDERSRAFDGLERWGEALDAARTERRAHP